MLRCASPHFSAFSRHACNLFTITSEIVKFTTFYDPSNILFAGVSNSISKSRSCAVIPAPAEEWIEMVNYLFLFEETDAEAT
jgi:hypothetical protein